MQSEERHCQKKDTVRRNTQPEKDTEDTTSRKKPSLKKERHNYDKDTVK